MNYHHTWEKLEHLLTTAERTLAGSAAQAPDDEESLAARLSAEHALLSAAATRDRAELDRVRARLDATLCERHTLATAVQELTVERDRLLAATARHAQEAEEYARSADTAARAQETLANENRFLQAELGYRTRATDELRAQLAAAQQVMEEQRAAMTRLSARQANLTTDAQAVPTATPPAVISTAALPAATGQRSAAWWQRVMRWLGEPMVVVRVEPPSLQRKQNP
jgi:chromosome segregation ATPase